MAGAPDGSLVVAMGVGINPPEIGDLVKLNPTTGQVTRISPVGCDSLQRDPISGSVKINDIVVAADGSIFALKRFVIGNFFVSRSPLHKRLVRIDAITRQCTSVSDATEGRERGTGPTLDDAETLAIAADGSLFVGVPGAVLRVDPLTGNRTVVIVIIAIRGSGPALGSVVPSLAVAADGSLFVGVLGAVLRVDPLTGNRRTFEVTGAVFGLAVAVDGSLFVGVPEAVLHVRLGSSGPSLRPVTSDDRGSGPPLSGAGALVVTADGSLFVGVPGAVLRVDLLTGDRVIIFGSIEDFEIILE